MASRKRIFIVQPYLRPPGGGNAVAACMIQALQDDHDVTLLTWEPVDIAHVNAYYGTAVDAASVRVRCVPRLLRLLTPSGGPLSLFKHNVLLRLCKMMRRRYDVVLGAHGESDFGCRGVQYVHYPRFADPRINPAASGVLDPDDLRWFHLSPLIMRCYFRLCGAISGFSFAGVRRNLTLVNSDWTGARVREVHDVSTRTIYPPVPTDFPSIPWEAREDGFVCVGRIAPAKRIERIIAILEAVHARGRAVHLHVVGSIDNARYFADIARQARASPLPVFLDTDLSHVDLAQLLARHRFGIHAMDYEHFGIAVAEMAKAGCIVFVPASGGQVEVVGGETRLIYADDAEAVDKIDAVLTDATVQERLRAHLSACGARFSTDRFIREIRALVTELAP